MKNWNPIIGKALMVAGIVIVAIFLINKLFPDNDPPHDDITIIVPGDSTFTVIDSVNNDNLVNEDTTQVPIHEPSEPIIIYLKDTSDKIIIDTNAIKLRYEKLLNRKDSLIRELMIRRNYSDTVHNEDAEIEAILQFSVQRNRLLPNRTYLFKNNREKVINQNIHIPDKSTLYWGVNAGYHFDMDILFGINIDYKVKNKLFGINLTTGFKPGNRFILLKYGQKF